MILYRQGSCIGIKERHKQFILSACTYSINDFNTKDNIAVLHQKQDWEAPYIKDLTQVISEHHTFISSNSFLIALLLLFVRSSFSPPQKSLCLYCKINRNKNEVEGQQLC